MLLKIWIDLKQYLGLICKNSSQMDSNPPQSVHQSSIDLLIWVLAKYKMYNTNETFILNASC